MFTEARIYGITRYCLYTQDTDHKLFYVIQKYKLLNSLQTLRLIAKKTFKW